MRRALRFLCIFAVPTFAAACSDVGQEWSAKSESGLREITKGEGLEELTAVGTAIRSFYGPLEYKKERFGFDLDASLAEATAEIHAGEREADFVRPIFKLLAKLKDGHVSYSYPLNSDKSFTASIPFVVTPLEGRYVVARIQSPELTMMAVGDTLVSIDGVSAEALEQRIFEIRGSGTPEHARHSVGLAMTRRPFYAPSDLLPRAGATAHVVLKHEAGSEYTVDVQWTLRRGLAAQITPPVPSATANIPAADVAFSASSAEIIRESVPEATLFEYGAKTPFFMTPQAREVFGIVDVAPKPATLASVGVTMPADPATAAEFISLRAYKYTHAGKTVLIVRIPAFTTPMNNYQDQVAWLSALLLDERSAAQGGSTSLADTPADRIVVDCTHNPGGLVPYVGGLARLFSSKPLPSFVQANHADRLWMAGLLSRTNASNAATQPIFRARLEALEAAYDQRKWLAPFAPLTGVIDGPTVAPTVESTAGADMVPPYPLVVATKPVLVLHDELSVSGGDAFPMVMQSGGFKTFGARTGGLGGSVEPVLTLPHSAARLNLTRGLFAAHNPGVGGEVVTHLVENNGVAPDYPHAVTVADMRAGYVGYVTAFSNVVVNLSE